MAPVVVCLVAMLWASQACAKPTSKPLVFRPTWQRVASDVSGVAASGRYVLVCSNFPYNGCTAAALINDQSGRRSVVTPPCKYPSRSVLGGPWLLMDCGTFAEPDIWLYPLAGGSWREDRAASSSFTPCDPQSENCDGFGAVAVGAHWVEWVVGGCYHCAQPQSPVYTNLQSGRQRPDPTNTTTVADLNSPSLAWRVCRPLKVPATPSGTYYGGPGGSAFALYGNFAVSWDDTSRQPWAYLGRCGSPLYLRLGLVRPLGNSNLLVWNATHGLGGIFLPSLRRLTIPNPPGAIEAVGPRHLYAIDFTGPNGFTGNVWSTPVTPLTVER